MGRTSDEEGESSTQTCELEDSDERPLKKARYIWQIKGKYHLKKPGDEEKDRPRMKHSLSGNTSPVDQVDGFVTLSSDVECSKSNLGDIENESVLSPIVVETAKSTEEVEPELVSLNVAYEVQQLADAFSTCELRKWQDRQISRSYVDNTINRVIEVMGFVPLPFYADDISDEEFSIPNNENEDDVVEDEAVLMAIHSHGLQRSEQEEHESHLDQCCNENRMSIVPCICNQQPPALVGNHTPYPFHQRPVLSHMGDLDQPCQSSPHPESQGPFVPVSTTTNSNLNVYPSSAVVRNRIESSANSAAAEVLVKNPLESSVVKKIPDKCVDMSNSTGSRSQPTKDDVNSSYFEHNDFLDQAVGVAIQKKGLSTLSCLEFG